MDKMLRQVGEIQNRLEHSGYYSLDSRIEESANGLGLGKSASTATWRTCPAASATRCCW